MLNKVMLIGNLGADPDTRYTQAGDPVCNIRVATSERWKDRNTGEPREKTEWHRVVIFGKLAEIATEYLRKGSKVYLEGKLVTRKWQDRDGNDRWTTEVVLEQYRGVMQMLGGKEDRGQGGGGQQQQGQQSSQPYDDDLDDIPF